MFFPRTSALLACLACSLSANASDFTVSSDSFENCATLKQTQVFNGFGCAGRNLSPALAWKGAPKGTRSFAVTVYDPDAPTGSGWWHWVVIDLPASTHSLPEGAGSVNGQMLPAGAVQVRSDYGTAAFGGACPPPGDRPHRYVVTVYALKVDHLDAPRDASPALIGFMIHGTTLGSASMQALYGR
ncbi:YbhB/YbcL family Raf kinase inhibitor-like protein [Dyella japonica]|uniref:Raf kinase inhibitor-like YbhB/YbcL family protein n=1 Tax=Dyella japonica TaxID=231455 RepID=A0ABV2K196_9GAMM